MNTMDDSVFSSVVHPNSRGYVASSLEMSHSISVDRSPASYSSTRSSSRWRMRCRSYGRDSISISHDSCSTTRSRCMNVTISSLKLLRYFVVFLYTDSFISNSGFDLWTSSRHNWSIVYVIFIGNRVSQHCTSSCSSSHGEYSGSYLKDIEHSISSS